MIDEDMREAQKRLDRINRSGRYSFKQTIDARGCIHVDCDLETFVREMNLISAEDMMKKLYSKLDNYAERNNIAL